MERELRGYAEKSLVIRASDEDSWLSPAETISTIWIKYTHSPNTLRKSSVQRVTV